MGLYKRFKGEGEQNEEVFSPEVSFNPIELEQAFDRAYRSYRINRISRIDVETFFDQFRQNLIDLMNRELTDLDSARAQMTAWISFTKEVEDGNGNEIRVDRVRLPFNSRMTEIF